MSNYIPGDVVRTATGRVDRIVTAVEGDQISHRQLKAGVPTGATLSHNADALRMITAAPRPLRNKITAKRATVRARARRKNVAARKARRLNRR